MKQVAWNELYEKYASQPHDVDQISHDLDELLNDPQVSSKKGIFEYLLSGSTDTKLLNVRVFPPAVKNRVYKRQTDEAKKNGTSNCPFCATEGGTHADKIWDKKDMEADHVTAWSKGGSSDEANCEMLCSMHNKAKGNA